MDKTQKGLTLVELMVVVAVMAIIATIAYPIYTNQVQKSRRADAKIALEMVAQAQERFYTLNGAYTTNLGTLQVSTEIQGGSSERGYYNLSVSHPGGDTQRFLVTADASSSGAQADDTACPQFTLNHQGERTPQGGGNNCW